MAARFRVIILDRVDVTDPRSIRAVFWADVPAARQPFYAIPGATSEWKDATAADNTALQDGSVTERVATVVLQAGWTQNQIRNELQTRWQVWQDHVTSWNAWDRYGSTWNGTSWTQGGVA